MNKDLNLEIPEDDFKLKFDSVEFNNESQKFKVKLSVDLLNIQYEKDLDGKDEKIMVTKNIFQW